MSLSLARSPDLPLNASWAPRLAARVRALGGQAQPYRSPSRAHSQLFAVRHEVFSCSGSGVSSEAKQRPSLPPIPPPLLHPVSRGLAFLAPTHPFSPDFFGLVPVGEIHRATFQEEAKVPGTSLTPVEEKREKEGARAWLCLPR